MKEKRTPKEVALALKRIEGQKFAGRKNGRYRISRAGLKTLADRVILTDAMIQAISAEALELGITVMNHDSYFAVIKSSLTENYRRVTKNILRENTPD
jgi:hypothetical protein